ncbi:thermonuclease family protein [Zavarzinia compransoris]|uniref:Nuclease (SNase) n=1 Tax=Zavarzinia compransoris TaxID=1264899 RepID=A0A317E2X4_9PROT|nr:thermonuclease family protein [Zavarzinia compransoris]PWR19733.1 nuclease (SNase) [Zavarzinia compransoris]TDP43318.1 nuclease-like protein [Zavarzinia compransoris]
MTVNRRQIVGGGAIGLGLILFGRRLAAAPALPGGLAPAGGGRVTEVVDGDTVRLDTGDQVRFVGTQAPKLPLDRPNFPTWPFAEQSKAILAALCQGKRVSLHTGGAPRDRHGRILAHLLVEETGIWLQGAMLEQGAARVYTFKDNRALAADMLAIEAAARKAKRGLWNDPLYRVRRASEADLAAEAGKVPGYHLVEGKVVKTGQAKGRWFLNFGPDQRSDFTATIAPGDAGAFAEAGIDPAAYQGLRLRIRGWIEDRNGASIDVTHPEQIERL